MKSQYQVKMAPPRWVDGRECQLCGKTFSIFLRQTPFSTLRKKHHCRLCGNVFCGTCSNAWAAIPEFGYLHTVRVCLPCNEKQRCRLTERKEPVSPDIDALDLQSSRGSCGSWGEERVEPSAPPMLEMEEDEAPTKWKSEPDVRAPHSLTDIDNLLRVFSVRLASARARGRALTTDSAAHTLFSQLRACLPLLTAHIRRVEEERERLERLQDKLAHVFDARAALDTLRSEHHVRREQEERVQARVQQQQVLSRLQQLRQQKQMEMIRQSAEACQYLEIRKEEMAKRHEAERLRLQAIQMQQRFPFSTSAVPVQPQQLPSKAGGPQCLPATSQPVQAQTSPSPQTMLSGSSEQTGQDDSSASSALKSSSPSMMLSSSPRKQAGQNDPSPLMMHSQSGPTMLVPNVPPPPLTVPNVPPPPLTVPNVPPPFAIQSRSGLTPLTMRGQSGPPPLPVQSGPSPFPMQGQSSQPLPVPSGPTLAVQGGLPRLPMPTNSSPLTLPPGGNGPSQMMGSDRSGALPLTQQGLIPALPLMSLGQGRSSPLTLSNPPHHVLPMGGQVGSVPLTVGHPGGSSLSTGVQQWPMRQPQDWLMQVKNANDGQQKSDTSPRPVKDHAPKSESKSSDVP